MYHYSKKLMFCQYLLSSYLNDGVYAHREMQILDCGETHHRGHAHGTCGPPRAPSLLRLASD